MKQVHIVKNELDVVVEFVLVVGSLLAVDVVLGRSQNYRRVDKPVEELSMIKVRGTVEEDCFVLEKMRKSGRFVQGSKFRVIDFEGRLGGGFFWRKKR